MCDSAMSTVSTFFSSSYRIRSLWTSKVDELTLNQTAEFIQSIQKRGQEGRKRHRKSTTYSAAYVLLCMSSKSTSPGLLTTKALWPEGIMWRVLRLEPYPICHSHSVSLDFLLVILDRSDAQQDPPAIASQTTIKDIPSLAPMHSAAFALFLR